jgi:ribosomal protein S1
LDLDKRFVFKIVNIDLHDRDIRLSLARRTDNATDPWDAFADSHEVGERHYGRVSGLASIEDDRTRVQLTEAVEGEVSESERDDFTRRCESTGRAGLQPNQKYVFKIEDINLTTRRISLSVERQVSN